MRIRSTLNAVLSASLVSAAGVHDYPVYRLGEKPTFDGKLEEAAWQGLPRGEGFFVVGKDGFAWRKPTSFRMGWDDDRLCIAVRCKEPFIHRVHPLPNDGDRLWSDESVELFLSVDGRSYCQFIFNTVGARWHATGSEDGTREQTVRELQPCPVGCGRSCWVSIRHFVGPHTACGPRRVATRSAHSTSCFS